MEINSLCFVSVTQTSSTPVKRGSIVCALLASQTSSTPVKRGSIVCALLASHTLVPLLLNGDQ